MDRQISFSGCRECIHEDLKGLIDMMAEKHGMGEESKVAGGLAQSGVKGPGNG